MVSTLRNCALVLMVIVLAAGFAAASDRGGKNNLRVDIRDACDPATFDAAVGPGACLPGHSGGRVTFEDFLAELVEEGSVGAWRFNPNETKSDKGVTFTLQNKGGETHTFTRVQEFGGGFVGLLNGPAGVPVPAPECTADGVTPQPPSANNVFVPAGQTVQGPTVAPGDTAKFQCCIHPWMRVTVTAEGQQNHAGHQH
jgi:hypothetical protein